MSQPTQLFCPKKHNSKLLAAIVSAAIAMSPSEKKKHPQDKNGQMIGWLPVKKKRMKVFDFYFE